MRSIPRPHFRFGLLGTFALISAVPVLLLGLVLANVLGNQIRDRSINADRPGDRVCDRRSGIGRTVSAGQLINGKTTPRRPAKP